MIVVEAETVKTHLFKYSVLIQVGYDPTVYVTSESEGYVVLNVRIFEPTSGGAPRPFTLSVSTQEGTAGTSLDTI